MEILNTWSFWIRTSFWIRRRLNARAHSRTSLARPTNATRAFSSYIHVQAQTNAIIVIYHINVWYLCASSESWQVSMNSYCLGCELTLNLACTSHLLWFTVCSSTPHLMAFLASLLIQNWHLNTYLGWWAWCSPLGQSKYGSIGSIHPRFVVFIPHPRKSSFCPRKFHFNGQSVNGLAIHRCWNELLVMEWLLQSWSLEKR